MKCSIKTCNNEAVWQVVLVLHPHPNYKRYRPARGNVGLFVCQECKAGAIVKVDDIITDETWSKLRSEMSTAGWHQPDRTRNQIDYDRMPEDGEVFATLP